MAGKQLAYVDLPRYLGRLKVKLRSFVYYHLLRASNPNSYRIIRLHKAVAPIQDRPA